MVGVGLALSHLVRMVVERVEIGVWPVKGHLLRVTLWKAHDVPLERIRDLLDARACDVEVERASGVPVESRSAAA